MPRVKKDSKILNIRMESNIYNELEKYCEEKGQTKTTAVERILKQHFEEDKSSKESH